LKDFFPTRSAPKFAVVVTAFAFPTILVSRLTASGYPPPVSQVILPPLSSSVTPPSGRGERPFSPAIFAPLRVNSLKARHPRASFPLPWRRLHSCSEPFPIVAKALDEASFPTLPLTMSALAVSTRTLFDLFSVFRLSRSGRQPSTTFEDTFPVLFPNFQGCYPAG